jgi:integrase
MADLIMVTMTDVPSISENISKHVPWNKGKVGAKPPLRPKHVWYIRTKLQVEGRTRDLALFNVAIDSKLRGCDVVAPQSRRGRSERLCGRPRKRPEATLIYRRTGNLRAVQLLLGHTKIESTVRYLGIEVDDALAIAEQVDL